MGTGEGEVAPVRSTGRTAVACGVDIGSTNIKIVAMDADGHVVARASRPTPRGARTPSIDAAALFRSIEQMIVALCAETLEVHAICAAGVGEDGVLVDSALAPLTEALAWFDPRRQSVFRSLRPRLHADDTFDAETDPVRTLVGWRWARAQPSGGDAAHWIALADYAGVVWSGRPYLSDTLASRTAAWRSRDRTWASDRVDLTLGSADLLPVVVRTGDVVGDLRSPLLRDSGALARDAIVVAGGHDHPIGGWGVDQIAPGAVLDSMGTAEVVVIQSPRKGAKRHDYVDVAPGIRSTGTTLLRVEELARNVAWASQDPAVAAQIHAILTDELRPLAVLDSGYFVPGRRGGGRPSYSLDAPRDPRARASAVLGALALAGRDAVDAVRKDASEPTEVRLAGGWVHSPGWVRIKTDVNGYSTTPVYEPEVTAVAAALLGAHARGWTPNPSIVFGGSAVRF
ncbi:xylulokinase [Rathayibacter sp. PhB152]|nr:xylulokinase [Rathayibacter sp. PhB152]